MEVYLKEGCGHQPHKNILILGEGNFSFAREFCATVASEDESSNNHIITTQNDIESKLRVYATSFDSSEIVHKNEFAKENVASLTQMKHVHVMHGVDATKLAATFGDGAENHSSNFSSIIFNFPHVGGKSNIRKCRLLLKEFFASASKFVCNEGRVLVALCKGQGGTPVDVDRGGYGNTWQVVSQAEISGFYLKDITKFEFTKLGKYKQAGYRGEIGNGFITRGGFVHVFAKGNKFQLPRHQNLFHMEELSDSETFQTHVKHFAKRIGQSEEVFSKLQQILRSLVQEKISSIENVSATLLDSLPSGCIAFEGKLYAPQHLNSFPRVCTTGKNNCYEFRMNVIDMTSPINPISHCVSQNLVYLHHGNLNSSLDVTDVIHYMFGEFAFETSECDCNDRSFSCQCACVIGSNPVRPKYSITDKNYENGLTTESIDPVPAFIENLPDSYWSGHAPECVISNPDEVHSGIEEDETEANLVYHNVSCDEYAMSVREELFFNRLPCLERDGDDVSVKVTQKRKVLIKGVCVMTIVASDEGNSPTTMLVLHMDQILWACYGLNDIRMLYAEDRQFHAHLSTELENDIKRSTISHIERKQHHYTKTIRFPLCHRHDFCFWLDGENKLSSIKDESRSLVKHCEEDLISTVRLVCGDVVHSMRLIKLLKHEETSMVSYCYRLIYGRLDGPLDHLTSVKVQNELRLYLLRLGFTLR